MTTKLDLLGKTISGVVASPLDEGGTLKIWMLQFTDGTHVEFVSPGARRAVERLARGGAHRREGSPTDAQLALNVA